MGSAFVVQGAGYIFALGEDDPGNGHCHFGGIGDADGLGSRTLSAI